MEVLYLIALIVGVCFALRYPIFWLGVAAVGITWMLGLGESNISAVFIIIGGAIGITLVALAWPKVKNSFADGMREDPPKP